MAGLNWQCCCGGTSTFCSDWVCECNAGRPYGWLTDGFTIYAEKSRIPGATSQGCCFNNHEYEIDLTAVPAGQIILNQNSFGEGYCCYQAQFDMDITGTVRILFDFDVFSGPPLYPNCFYDNTLQVNETVPCLYTVVCQENGTFRHRLTVCHFQIECDFGWYDSDCEENCNFIDGRGLRCAGGTFEWYTDAVDMLGPICPDESDVLVTYGPNICATEDFGCLTVPAPFDHYAQLYSSCGPAWFFGMYTTDQCSPGQDYYEPCDPVYNAYPTASCPLFSPIPFSSESWWCLGNNGGVGVHIDNYEQSCYNYYTNIQLDTGDIV